jgi:hypothetical protein
VKIVRVPRSTRRLTAARSVSSVPPGSSPSTRAGPEDPALSFTEVSDKPRVSGPGSRIVTGSASRLILKILNEVALDLPRTAGRARFAALKATIPA